MRTLRLVPVVVLSLCWALAFAARMPSNTVVLADDTRTSSATARLEARRAQVQRQARAVESLRQHLVQKGAFSPRTVMPKFDTFVMTGTATTRTRSSVTRSDERALTFAYSGWSATDEQKLRTFVTQAYPVLVNIYGQPASSATVTIAAGGFTTGIEGGELTINQTSGDMQLVMEPLPSDFASGDYSHYGKNLLHMILHAFHAPTLIGYDAWEEGMARAAALIAIMQINPTYDPGYDGDYLLTLYDYLNQPGLANAIFFPAQGEWLMGPWRIGMAMSAWLKIYVEKPTVFNELNALYYANTGAAGNIAALKSMLASVVPYVEGVPTLQWYDLQHVLRPTTVTGSRIFVYQYPAHEHIALLIHYFFSNIDGTERPLATGTSGAQLKYYSYDQIELYSEEGNVVHISSTGYLPGIGTINPSFYNIGDPPIQRVRITIDVNGLKSTAYFPYWVQGFAYDENLNVTDANEIYGAVVGADTGTVNIALPGLSLQPNLIQGAFGAQLTTSEVGISFFAPVLFTVNANGTFVDFRRNIGPGFYAALLLAGDETLVTLSHTFPTRPRMISFPLTPNQSDIAQMLGYATGVPLSLAWWDPTAPRTDKYRYHPDVPPVQPGQAYWFNTATPLSVTIPGRLADMNDPRQVTLYPGWNMVGNSYTTDLNPWAMIVEAGSISYTLPEAIKHGLVEPLWRYADGGSYLVGATLPAWEGGWMRNLTDQPLVLRQQDAARASARAVQVDVQRMLTEGGWGVNLQASTGRARDTMAVAGISTRALQGADALDWQKPPAMGDGVRVAFIHPSNRLAGAAYATDIRQSIGMRGETWEFDVTSGTSETVTLSWPDLRLVPPQYHLILEDVLNGKRQYLRTTPTYAYQATGTREQPDVRRFRLVVAPRGTAPLSFLDFVVVPTRGSGTSMIVRLNAAADLRLDVRSPSGKLIRTINVPAPANEQVVIPWDGRAAGGKLAPGGTYIVTITARTADGYVVRRNQPLQLSR